MNAVAFNPLQPVIDMLDKAFPQPPAPTAAQRAAWAEADARDAARQDFVARRTPELTRQYRMDESRLRDAVEEAGRHFSTGMALAYRQNDDAELGRLLRARIDEHLRSEAADAAEDEGYVMFPELPL